MSSITIELKGLPPTPNARMHWRAKAKHNRQWREVARIMASRQKPPQPWPRVKLELTRYSSAPCDQDNNIASLKPVIDGIRDAGIMVDDNPNCVESITARWETAKQNEGRVRVRVIERMAPVEKDTVTHE